jgi:hypothetical protein
MIFDHDNTIAIILSTYRRGHHARSVWNESNYTGQPNTIKPSNTLLQLDLGTDAQMTVKTEPDLPKSLNNS